MTTNELNDYIEFWAASLEEERKRAIRFADDEIKRRKAAYAQWLADLKLREGKKERRKRLMRDARLKNS